MAPSADDMKVEDVLDTTSATNLAAQAEKGLSQLQAKLEDDAQQLDARLAELKRELGCGFGVLKLLALTLALLIGGLLCAILFVFIALVLVILALLFLILVAILLAASVLGIIASTIGLAIAPITICVSAATAPMMSAKLAKARDAFALQYHADVAQLNALLQYLNENQEELLLKLVKQSSSLTPAISAIISRTERFFGPAGSKSLERVTPTA